MSAYTHAATFFGWLSPNIWEFMEDASYPSSAREEQWSARKELRYVAMLGWNSRVRESADRLIRSVQDLSGALTALMSDPKNPNFGDRPWENAKKIPERHQAAIDALDDYVRAVAWNGPLVTDSDPATEGRTDRGVEDGERPDDK